MPRAQRGWITAGLLGILALGLAGCGNFGVGEEGRSVVGTGSSFTVTKHDYGTVWEVTRDVVQRSGLEVTESDRSEGRMRGIDGETDIRIRIRPPESGYKKYKVAITNNLGAAARVESQPWEPKLISRIKADLDKRAPVAQRRPERRRQPAPRPEAEPNAQQRQPERAEPTPSPEPEAAQPAPDRAAPAPAPVDPEDVTVAFGMRLAPVSQGIRQARGVPGEQGVLVQGLKAGPARSAGLQPGDIILELGGTSVNSPANAKEVLARTDSGAAIRTLIQREEWTLLLTMEAP